MHTFVRAKMIKQIPPLCTAALIRLSFMYLSEKEIQESAVGGARIYLPCSNTVPIKVVLTLSHGNYIYHASPEHSENQCDYLTER